MKPAPTTAAAIRPARKRCRAALALTALALLVGAGVLGLRWPRMRNAREARRAFAAGRYADAGRAIDRWLASAHGSAEALVLKARVALARNRPREAAEALQAASDAGAHEAQIRLVRAILDAKLGRHAEAAPTLALAFDEPHAPDPQLDEALARVYLETYDLPRAEAVIERWMADAPHDAKPYLWRTEIDHRVSKAGGRLIGDYREALKRDPDLADARLGLAEHLRKTHHCDDAAPEYAAYLAGRPEDPAGHLGAGLNALELGDEAAASRHLDRAITLDPKNPQVYTERAQSELRRGRFDAAIVLLDRAVALDPYDVQVRYNRGVVLTRLGRAEEALAEHKAADRLRAEKERLSELQRRLVQTPQDREIQARIAHWMFDNGHGPEAVHWAEKLLKEQPGHPGMSRRLVEYYERQGKKGLANFYRLHASPPPESP